MESDTSKDSVEKDSRFTPPLPPDSELPQPPTPTTFVSMDFSETQSPSESKTRKTFKQMNLREKADYVASCITVEPLVICYIIPSVLSSITTLNLNIEKACRANLNYGDEICTAISNRDYENYTEEYNKVSDLVANMNIWMSALRSAGPAVLVLFVGSWSDRRHRRKPLILAPIIGELCTSVGLLLCAIFLLQWPLEAAGIIEAVFPALSGGLPFVFIACFATIGEVTTEEDRTFRIGLFAFIATAATPVAVSISGYTHESLGYLGVYPLVTLLYIFAIVYAVKFFKEPITPVPRPAGVSFLKDFFDWHHVKNTVTVALRNGPGRRRFRVILLVILYITIEGPLNGEFQNLFLFTLTNYQWTSTEFALYSTYEIVMGLIGNAVVTLILIKVIKLRDCYVGVIGVLSRVIAVPLFAFGYLSWHMYAARLIAILSPGTIISMRSLATKMVSPDELGQLMGFLAIIETIIPVAFNPLYGLVFVETKNTFPGAFYFLTAGTLLLALLSYLLLEKFLRDLKAEEGKKKKEEKDGVSQGVTNMAFIGCGTDKTQNTYL